MPYRSFRLIQLELNRKTRLASKFTLLLFLPLYFSLSNAQTLQTIYAFISTNGCNPQAPVIVGSDGNFYGTTPVGGTNGGYGTIFKLTTNGVLTSIFQFSLTNGASPYAGLTLGSDGNLYGTTKYGGFYGKGIVFKTTTDGVFTTLLSFSGTNGANSTAGLTQAMMVVFMEQQRLVERTEMAMALFSKLNRTEFLQISVFLPPPMDLPLHMQQTQFQAWCLELMGVCMG